MMEFRGIADPLLAVISAVLTWQIWRYHWLPAVTADFREELFEVRRRLFAFVAEADASFDDSAYRRLHGVVNGLLYSAERVTAVEVISVAWASVVTGKQVEDNIDTAIRDTKDEDLRVQLRASYRDVLTLIARYSFWQSAISIPVVPFAVLWELLLALAAWLANLLNQTAAAAADRIQPVSNRTLTERAKEGLRYLSSALVPAGALSKPGRILMAVASITGAAAAGREAPSDGAQRPEVFRSHA